MNEPANPLALLESVLTKRVAEARKRDIWSEGGRFRQIKDLSMDTRGVVGEEFMEHLFLELGCRVERSNETDRTKKHWDLRLNEKVHVEVKTASVGKDGKSFQHENIEKDRDYHWLILLDVMPNDIYLTVAEKKSALFQAK